MMRENVGLVGNGSKLTNYEKTKQNHGVMRNYIGTDGPTITISNHIMFCHHFPVMQHVNELNFVLYDDLPRAR